MTSTSASSAAGRPSRPCPVALAEESETGRRRSYLSEARAAARTWLLARRFEGRFDRNGARVMTSSPRSGSTFFSQLAGAAHKTTVLFEPLHLTQVPEARKAGFSWQTYRHPDESWPEGERFLSSVFEGRLVNSWLLREATSFRDAWHADTLVVKFVRANRLLPWLCRHFDLAPPIHLLRHPCAVIASQLDRSWLNPDRPDVPAYLQDLPVFRAAVEQANSPMERLASTWALDQLPALLHRRPHPWHTVTYEELLLNPAEAMQRIGQLWRLEIDADRLREALARPSSVVGDTGVRGKAGWQERLSERQVSEILSTIRRFGIDFYSRAPDPDLARLRDPTLPARLRHLGQGDC